MKKLALVALLGFFAFTTNTFARIVVEPQVGYTFGTFDPNSTGQSSIDLKGFNFGAKLYYESYAWFAGVDYNYNKLDLEDVDDDLTNNEIGAILGLNFARFFKLYGGYIFSNTGKVAETIDGKSGYKIGLSFLALRNLSIGVEYKKVEYKKGDYFEKDPFYTGTTLLVSFPFGN